MRSKLKKIRLLYQINAFLKVKLQEKKATDELAYYQAEAARKGIIVQKGEELDQALTIMTLREFAEKT